MTYFSKPLLTNILWPILVVTRMIFWNTKRTFQVTVIGNLNLVTQEMADRYNVLENCIFLFICIIRVPNNHASYYFLKLS